MLNNPSLILKRRDSLKINVAKQCKKPALKSVGIHPVSGAFSYPNSFAIIPQRKYKCKGKICFLGFIRNFFTVKSLMNRLFSGDAITADNLS